MALVRRPLWAAALIGLLLAVEGRTDPLTGALSMALTRPLAELDGRHARTVWTRDLAGRLTPFLDERRRRLRLAALVVSEARRAKLPPGLVMAVIEVESGFERFALSPAGARGLMQIMPFWRQRLDRAGRNGNPDDDLFRPAVNLRYGCTILRHYLERADGDIARALASYNGSAPGDGYVARVRRAYRERWAQP